MTQRLRVGIVGSSFGGAVHAPSFAAHERFEVVAIASPRNAAEVARQRGIPSSYMSVEAMLDAANLDVLSVASPPFDHHRSVLAGLDAGLHILCEKPFALNVAQAEELCAAATTAGTACALAHEFRFLPTRRALKELVVHGHLAPLRHIEFTQQSTFLRADSLRRRSWWFDREAGGGIAGAWLSHSIDTATWLAGSMPLTSIGTLRTANRTRRDEQGEFISTVDDAAFAVVTYADGLIARLSADGTLCVESSILGVHGEHRTAVASGASIYQAKLYTVDDDETAELEIQAVPRAALASIHQSVPAFASMLDAFAEMIDGKPSEIATFADGLATQRVLASIGY